MDPVELSRMLENLIRLGTVLEVDHARARIRVQSGKLNTQWIPWLTSRAGETKTWSPPTVGEQVILLSPSGEPAAGVALTGLYSDAKPSPSISPNDHVTTYPDGARISYDHVTGHLECTGIKTALVQASESVTADTPFTHITGDVKVDGDVEIMGMLTYRNGLSGNGGESNGNTIVGSFNRIGNTHHDGTFTHVGGELTSHGKVLHTHVHGGVTPGGGTTGVPA